MAESHSFRGFLGKYYCDKVGELREYVVHNISIISVVLRTRHGVATILLWPIKMRNSLQVPFCLLIDKFIAEQTIWLVVAPAWGKQVRGILSKDL